MNARRDLAALIAAILVAGALAFAAGDYWIGLGISLAMWIALTQSWAVLSGLTGYISLGHVVFYGLGAYLVVASWEWLPLWIALPLAGAASALFAFLVGLPVLRVRGPYFVILTFGLAELVKFVVIAGESALGHASRVLLGAPSVEALFAMMLVLAILACVLGHAVRASRFGRGLRAIRENEEAAETIGIPIARYKLAAFVLSAILPGVVGGVMALRATYFEPLVVFDPMISFSMIAMAILGGSDDVRGPVIGAVFLAVLSELLWINAPQLYMILLGVVLVAFVLWRPQGLLAPREAKSDA
jgi:branched-chain amino acid transport system permease protein